MPWHDTRPRGCGNASAVGVFGAVAIALNALRRVEFLLSGHLDGERRDTADSVPRRTVTSEQPKIAQEIADVNVRSHTFAFITPSMTDEYKIPNPCMSCHTDRTTVWARDAIKGWRGISPWRAR
jgi:hypothetical protein